MIAPPVSRSRRLALLASAFALGSCATNFVAFRPREQFSAESPGGHPAAQYQLERAGRTIAEVRIWSEGVERFDDGTIAHVGVEIENHGDATLSLEPKETYLQAVELDDRSRIDRLDDPSIEGLTAAQARELRRIDLEYLLPDDVGPGDVEAFAVRWGIRAEDDGTEFRNVTPFGRDNRYGYRRPYYYGFHIGYYRPFYWGYCW